MTEVNAPRVRLPDATPQKVVVPGPNSWAQEQQQEQQRNSTADSSDDIRPTNRDKYEHKPMPLPPPPTPEDEASHQPFLLQPKTYVQPAIPIIPNHQKYRAVTDPVAPKPLFSGKSVRQLRRKYSQSKGKDGFSKEGLDNSRPTSPDVPVTSEKAAEVLGLYPFSDNSRRSAPTSEPIVSAPDVFQDAHEESQERTVAPARQAQSSPVPTRSTPVPTRRYLQESRLPVPSSTERSNHTQQQAGDKTQDAANGSDETQGFERTHGFLHPARIGKHTNVGEVGLVEGQGMHRVESFRGVIEDAPTSNGSNGQRYADSSANLSQLGTGQGYDTGGPLLPNVYSPSSYSGVWEHDSAVGQTPPLFTPTSKGYTLSADNANQNPNYSPLPQPSVDRRSHYAMHRFSNYQHPPPSVNSWTSNNPHGNSFAPPTAPPSAPVPPRWPHYQTRNSVPSPPQNQQDFQRAGSITAALAQIELTLHHHIDGTFGSLSRLITDKHDQITDQTIRRLENVEHALHKGFKDLKSEARDIRNHVGNLQGDVRDVKKRYDSTMDSITGLDTKLQALERHIEAHACKCQLSVAEQSVSEPESDRVHRSAATSQTSYRRTESAHPTLGKVEFYRQHRNGASRTSNNVRVSGTSSRRDRSETLNSQQSASGTSDERSNRKEYFADLGAARGPVPDLRDHPAFADTPLAQGHTYGYGLDHTGISGALNGLPYENPSLSDGRWYQQAYGQHN